MAIIQLLVEVQCRSEQNQSRPVENAFALKTLTI